MTTGIYERAIRDFSKGTPIAKLKIIYKIYAYAADSELPYSLLHGRKRSGLCNFIKLAADSLGGNYEELTDLQKRLFIRARLYGVYTLNDRNDYQERAESLTQNLCENRLAWIRHILGDKAAEDFTLNNDGN